MFFLTAKTKTTTSPRRYFFWFPLKDQQAVIYLLAWFFVNLITASFTELYSDEAYYWMYSRFLDWGYLDHPPMVAVLIKLGTVFGRSEIAVRIIPLIVSTGALWLIYQFCRPIQPKYFFATVFSMLSLNLMGFLSVPDAPLLFFGALFFYGYRQYLRDPSVSNAILIGIVAAALLYSKYHGILIITFTLLSNLKLFRQKSFYLAIITTVVLLIPHIIWQVQHHFASLQYHLFDRGGGSFHWKYTMDYVLGNLPFHGPWVSLVLFVCAIVYRPTDLWERALKWNLLGIFGFFLLMTNSGYVEANWTLLMTIPLLILGLKKLMLWKSFAPVYLKICYFFIGAMLLMRVVLIFPIESLPIQRMWEFKGSKAFAQRVFDQASGLPVVANKYQNAALLSFYWPSKDYLVPAINIGDRRNQYDLWDLETILCGRPVLYINDHMKGPKITGRKLDNKTLTKIDHLPPLSGYKLEIIKANRGPSQVDIEVHIHMPNGPCFNEVSNSMSLQTDLWSDGEIISSENKDLEYLTVRDTELMVVQLLIPIGQQVPNAVSFSLYFKDLQGTNGILARQNL